MRHVIRLYNYYKSYDNFFKMNNLEIDTEEIEKYYEEFSSSSTLRLYNKDSEKFFDYLINRFHLLGTFNQFDYTVPLVYKTFKAIYEYDLKLDMYVGFVENEFDTAISGKTLNELEEDFKNTVDFVVLKR